MQHPVLSALHMSGKPSTRYYRTSHHAHSCTDDARSASLTTTAVAVAPLVLAMGQAVPNWVRAEKLSGEAVRLEETRFRKTLERGLSILDEKSAGLKKGDMCDGDTSFFLYNPHPLTLALSPNAPISR